MRATSKRRVSTVAGIVLLAAAATGVTARTAWAQLRVVATTEDLASLTREVGGDRVRVTAIARGYQDPHFVDAKPSYILELNRADLLVLVGRELELAWLPALTTAARNAKVQPGATGYLDASVGVKILEIPTGQVTRAMGDVHSQGNPHYWLDPANGRIIAASIRDRLSQLAPADRDYFAARYAAFDARLTGAERRWEAQMAPFKGRKLVTYHRSWPNLMERFGLEVIGYVEPKPGIPPSPSHTLALMSEMKAQGVRVIVVEPYFEKRTPESIASQVGGQVIELAPSVGGVEAATDYIALFDYNLSQLAAALKQR